jgi:hypothetical protein
MACLIFKTEKPINGDDFVDFFDKKKWGKNIYPFVDHYDPSCLAWISKLSYWEENDDIEREIQRETGVSPDEQVLLDKMPDIALERWRKFSGKVAEITDKKIDEELPGIVARMPGWQTKELPIWRLYFTMKRDYIKAIVDAGIKEVDVFI